MDPAGSGVYSWDTELAWHIVTVLVRIGRPAAAAELAAWAPAANYVTPQRIESLCHTPGSPLRFSDGVVDVSETAVVSFLRFMGRDVLAPPRVELRAPEARMPCPEVPIWYGRKRKPSDAADFGVKRRLLMETDADSVERDQQQSLQLIVHSGSSVANDADSVEREQQQSQQLIVPTCPSVATREVNLEVMQDMPPTLGTSIVSPSKLSTGVPLVSGDANISPACLQPNQFLGVCDDNVLADMTSALVPKEFPISSSIDIPSICAEKSGNIHAPADNEISKIGEPEGALSPCNCRVEDSEDIQKESTLLPLTLDASLVGDEKVWVDEDLNLIWRRPCSRHRHTHAVDNIVRSTSMPDQVAVVYDSPDAGYREEIPSHGQDANPSVGQKNKTIHVSSPTQAKAEPVIHELIHEVIESSCQPSLDTKVEPAALPLEATSHDCLNNKNLNIIAENIESTYQNGKEQSHNEVSRDFPKKEQDRKIVKQKQKRKKNDAVPKEDKDQGAENAQKGHEEPKPLPSFKDFVVEEEEDANPSVIQKNKTIEVSSPTQAKTEHVLHELIHEVKESSRQPSLDTKVEPAALPLEATSYNCIDNKNLNIIAENIESTYQNGKEQPHNEVSIAFPKKEQDKKIVKQKEKHLNIIAENIESPYQNGKEQTHNEVSMGFPKKEQDKKIVKQKEKRKKNDALPKEDKDQGAENAQKDHEEPKPLPSFKDFVVEEEEGSGGYGIVYRAQRKEDGRVFAIKCPRGKAHSHHVENELKMLKRFGGRNFVIRYEGDFRSGELDCFVLQHVKHDRPENLKKEIDLFQLQWYGYCLLRALSSLHKEGIVHRDVKPGNFLFSRDQTKGYLIDFNLANDLHQKLSRNSKSETFSCGKDITSQSSLKSALVIHANEAAADSKQPLGSKRKRSNKIPVGRDPRIDTKSMYGSQAADGSGVTSAKEATSTKTSLDRLKQPILFKGRKELMNLYQEVIDSPNQNKPAAPVSQRKRVAAPVGGVDQKLFLLTPMPLRSGGSPVAGSGLLNSKGHGKQRREGPCVGTKGFRAPEVLLRSSHQGCKVDVWSAGVTFLYLITGKTPFGGDPEQNMKEIVKLRGSEELWEVAKLHNCESSYPSELFEAKFLQSVDIKTWCVANARRPEFLKQLPDSLFDLVDKCLAVNPRCRITSEDALSHEFFAPCHESLRKHKSKTLRTRGLAGVASLPPCSPRDTIAKASKS